MDFNLKLKSGLLLKGMIHSPGEDARAVVILVHGLGEHIQRYSYWADLFKKEGIAFAGLDLPGHGRSEGKRGYIRSFSQSDEMIDILIKTCSKTFPGVPLFLYGHSLGGGIVLDYLIRKNPKIKGAIVTSPWLRLSFEPPKIKVTVANIVRFILPGLIQPSGLIVSHISHDQSVVDKYNSDPLVHGKISVSLFHSAMKAAEHSLEHASELKVKTLLIHGSEDMLCSSAGSSEFASKNVNVELRIWEGGFHELHNEPFKDDVFRYIISWISKL